MSDAQSFRYLCAAQIRRGHRAWVEALRDAALAKMAGGKGGVSALLQASANGKSFTFETRLSSIQVAEITMAALDEADGLGRGSTGITVPDFSSVVTPNPPA